jgi:hypothetical protein
MSRPPLRVVAPDRRKDHDRLLDLLGKVFSHPDYFQRIRRCREGYVDGSHYDWAASRVGFVGERMVTHWGVWGYRMRIGRCTVRVGGIGSVATHGDFRRRGLMARTARESIAAMTAGGYDMSVLFAGVRAFYGRFGYVRAWDERRWIVAAGDLPSERAAARVRRFAPKARADLDALYNRHSVGLTGTAVRPTFRRGRLVGGEGYLWRGAGGVPAGWVVLRGSECLDHAGDAEQVLRVLGRLARRRGWREVRFAGLHDDSALCRRLRQGYCRSETHRAPQAGAMIRTLSLRRTLAQIAPELSRRLKASPLAAWRGRLLMADARERVTLAIAGGKVAVADAGRAAGGRPAGRHAIRGGEHVAQLLIGTDGPQEIVEAAGMRLSGDARALVGALFCAQHPTLNAPDRF